MNKLVLVAALAFSYVAQAEIICITNENSNLSINDTKKIVVLKGTNGQTVTYKIIKTDMKFYETFPGKIETTYSLNDGRSIEIMFTEGEKVGSGNWIRLNKSRSPYFKSCIAL
jgi:hypothetical protein